jgi:hypothetical protein
MLNYTVTEIRQKIAASLTDAERAEWQRELERAGDTTRELMDKRLGKVSADWDKQLRAEYRRGAYRNGYGY